MAEVNMKKKKLSFQIQVTMQLPTNFNKKLNYTEYQKKLSTNIKSMQYSSGQIKKKKKREKT